MRKLLAKFLQWCLFKLGYTEVYSRKREIEINITANADQFLKEMEKCIREAKKLRYIQESMPKKPNG